MTHVNETEELMAKNAGWKLRPICPPPPPARPADGARMNLTRNYQIIDPDVVPCSSEKWDSGCKINYKCAKILSTDPFLNRLLS